jgi:hypothetical protein
MNVITLLATHAIADSSVTALLGTRVYRLGEVPEGATLPYAVPYVENSEPENTSLGAGGLCRTTVRVAVLDDDYNGAWAAALAIRDALNGCNDDVIDSTMLVRKADGEFIPPDDSSETGTYQVLLDFEVHHTE